MGSATTKAGSRSKLDEWRESMAQMIERQDKLAAGAKWVSGPLDEWRESMAQMIKRQDELAAEGKWVSGPADMLGIAQVARNEMVHTRMLAWLLDPRGKHRLGDAVLRRVVGHATAQGEAPSPLVVRSVHVSHWLNNREADIVVFGRDFTLVIEVKVDAGEQKEQCNDLYKNYGPEPGPLFLFLTPGGWPPHTATGAAQSAFKTVSWKQVRKMIECALGSRDTSHPGAAVPGTTVPAEYVVTLKEQFR